MFSYIYYVKYIIFFVSFFFWFVIPVLSVRGNHHLSNSCCFRSGKPSGWSLRTSGLRRARASGVARQLKQLKQLNSTENCNFSVFKKNIGFQHVTACVSKKEDLGGLAVSKKGRCCRCSAANPTVALPRLFAFSQKRRVLTSSCLHAASSRSHQLYLLRMEDENVHCTMGIFDLRCRLLLAFRKTGGVFFVGGMVTVTSFAPPAFEQTRRRQVTCHSRKKSKNARLATQEQKHVL